jgi:hypothetical protein
MTKLYEKDEHIRLCVWLRHCQVLFLHVPNEGKRSVQEAMMLQRMGLSKGAPDFIIFDSPDPKYKGVAIELKVQGGRASKEQKEWIQNLRDRGWAADFCWSYLEAVKWLMDLGFKEREMLEVCGL